MKKIVFGFGILIALGACREESADSRSIAEISTEGKISSIIRNPISATQPLDTVNIAKIEFTQTEFDFGEIDEGGVIKHTFEFTNKGAIPLLISDARSTCGCTVPDWPKEPIPPGGSGEIRVEFRSAGKKDLQDKPITITANTYPSETRIHLKGFVRPKND
ncbi:MAG: DUF1573 domain-containing protein [Saprospiraceae bacterium]|nr:DUF1573 domain-containing protein [Saprospiraceae bacterium]